MCCRGAVACLNRSRSVAGGPAEQTAARRLPGGAGSIFTYSAHLHAPKSLFKENTAIIDPTHKAWPLLCQLKLVQKPCS